MVDKDLEREEKILIDALKKVPKDARKEIIRYVLSIAEDQKKTHLKLVNQRR